MSNEPHRIPRPIREIQYREVAVTSRLDQLRQALTYLTWALVAGVWIANLWAGWQLIGQPLFAWMGHQ